MDCRKTGGKVESLAQWKVKVVVDHAGHSGKMILDFVSIFWKKLYMADGYTIYMWCYSATGALEAAYAQAYGGKSISLSEQQLVDCAGAFNNFGCSGGLPSQAFEYIKYNGGLETEAAYPYTAKDGVCKFSSENVAVKLLDSVNITLVRSCTISLWCFTFSAF